MQKIDSHQHFWQYDANKHNWIDDDMAVIRKDFLPADLLPVLQQNNIAGCVAVQADETEDDTNFLIRLSAENTFIKGVVGWVDIRAENLEERLHFYKAHPVVKGFRHVLQGEAPGFMLQPSFVKGIAAFKAFNFTYDLLIFAHHLNAALELVRKFPDQKFVVDHIAKPSVKTGLTKEWQVGMKALASCKNVFCKVSGMVTEAHYQQWKKEDFTPYLDVVINAFGINRLMFGSDWPVCLVAASYAQMLGIVQEYFTPFSISEQEGFFGGNAAAFYQLEY